jgi:hypothetical protein
MSHHFNGGIVNVLNQTGFFVKFVIRPLILAVKGIQSEIIGRLALPPRLHARTISKGFDPIDAGTAALHGLPINSTDQTGQFEVLARHRVIEVDGHTPVVYTNTSKGLNVFSKDAADILEPSFWIKASKHGTHEVLKFRSSLELTPFNFKQFVRIVFRNDVLAGQRHVNTLPGFFTQNIIQHSRRKIISPNIDIFGLIAVCVMADITLPPQREYYVDQAIFVYFCHKVPPSLFSKFKAVLTVCKLPSLIKQCFF